MRTVRVRACAYRIEGAAEVVRLDHGVHEEGRAARRQAEGAPQVRERADQLRVGGEARELLQRRRHRQEKVDQRQQGRVDGARQQLEGGAGAQRRARAVQLATVGVDGRCLAGEACAQLVEECGLRVPHQHALVARDHLVEDGARAGPLDGAGRRHVEQRPEQLAHVVQSGVHLKALLLKRVSRAAGAIVLLEHDHAVAGLGAECGGQEARDATADDEHVDRVWELARREAVLEAVDRRERCGRRAWRQDATAVPSDCTAQPED